MLTSAATFVLSSWKTTTEKFEEGSGSSSKNNSGVRDRRLHEPEHYSRETGGAKLSIFFWIIVAIEVLIGVLAAYLSWWANSLIDWNIPLKLFFSFFAFLCSWIYVIHFLIHKVDMAFYIKRHIAQPQMQMHMQQQQQLYGRV